MRPHITIGDVGHAYGVEPGNLWFSGRVAGGPKSVVGHRITVRLTEEAAARLASELLAIVSARRARRCAQEAQR